MSPPVNDRDRSRSPKALQSTKRLKDSPVQFFHATDLADMEAQYISPAQGLSRGSRLLQSHGWVDGTMGETFDAALFNPDDKETWPWVVPDPNVLFSKRGEERPVAGSRRRVHLQTLRTPTAKRPLLSLLFVRWSGEHVVGCSREDGPNDGDWGTYGCPASDEYMSAVVRKGLTVHPRLQNGSHPKFEVFSLFVRHSADVETIVHVAPWVAGSLTGKKKTSFWMLWPVEWEDVAGADYAGYVERRAFFSAMRACEAAGVPSGFPHPADQYELITSKSWMATLSLDPRSKLPAATLVNKASVLRSPTAAARQALGALEYIRHLNPCSRFRGNDVDVGPSMANKDGVKKGVVKLGFSWEARYVAIFSGEAQLAEKLQEMMTHPRCLSSTCVVQEWVDFDLEMRLYFLPPSTWEPAQKLKPVRIECNSWSGTMANGERQSFHRLSEEDILRKWNKDQSAYDAARKQATNTAQYLIAWLRAADAQTVSMVRLDFMVLRVGPGRVQVVFGEFCEMGACCLGWEEGPPTIWRAALNRILE